MTTGSPNRRQLHQNPWPFMLLFAVFALAGLAAAIAADERGSSGDKAVEVPPTQSPEPGADTNTSFCQPGGDAPFSLDEIEGKSLEDAEDWAEENDYSIRTVVIDGEPQAATMDYRPERVNVEVDSGTVTAFCGMG